MRYLSLFSGIGGFELGIGKKHECVGYSEIDKHAIQIYQKHFPKHKNYGDITKIKEKELPDFDLLVGGFPCQSFSIAGKRAGFDDTRGTLFFDIARILSAKNPRLLVLENVKGLLSHDEGRTFKTIIRTLDELGYDLQWQVLNSKNFGVPQNRERIIIVGHLRGTGRPEVFPFPEDAGLSLQADESVESQPQAPIASTIRTKQGTRADDNFVVVGTLRTHKSGQGFRQVKSGISPTIPARAREDGSGQPVIYVPEATKKGYAEARPGQSINLTHPKSSTRRGRVSDIAGTLDTGMHQHTLTRQGGVRRLTSVECERLQGFPDDWTAGISDTQRYKCCGNAVTTNVIKAIIKRLK